MLSAEQNDRITRVGPANPAGNLLRRYWQPAALVDELAGDRPIKPVKLLGEDLVILSPPHTGVNIEAKIGHLTGYV